MEQNFGPGLAGLLVMAGDVMLKSGQSALREKGMLLGPGWLRDADAFDEAVDAAMLVLSDFRPGGRKLPAATSPVESIAELYASDALFKVCNTRTRKYPFFEKERIDLVRRLLTDELIAQSCWLREQHSRDAEIEAARLREQQEHDAETETANGVQSKKGKAS